MHMTELSRNEVLYDEQTLTELVDEHGKATAIKEAISTPAFVYEIRTAIEYWSGGQADHRTNDNVWDTCQAVDDDHLTLVSGELKYADDVDL